MGVVLVSERITTSSPVGENSVIVPSALVEVVVWVTASWPNASGVRETAAPTRAAAPNFRNAVFISVSLWCFGVGRPPWNEEQIQTTFGRAGRNGCMGGVESGG